MKGLKVLSLFDGISCGRVALERAGIPVDTYYASEIDKYAIQVTMANYPDTIQLGSITEWQSWNIEKPDIIIGGFPCQPYSIAGKRKGLEDERSGNILECLFSVIEKYQPENLMLENVVGLLSIDSGNTFKHILKQLNNIGYAVDWIKINSALVSAQNRERIYIIGKRLDKCKGLHYEVFLGQNNERTDQGSLF